MHRHWNVICGGPSAALVSKADLLPGPVVAVRGGIMRAPGAHYWSVQDDPIELWKRIDSPVVDRVRPKNVLKLLHPEGREGPIVWTDVGTAKFKFKRHFNNLRIETYRRELRRITAAHPWRTRLPWNHCSTTATLHMLLKRSTKKVTSHFDPLQQLEEMNAEQVEDVSLDGLHVRIMGCDLLGMGGYGEDYTEVQDEEHEYRWALEGHVLGKILQECQERGIVLEFHKCSPTLPEVAPIPPKAKGEPEAAEELWRRAQQHTQVPQPVPAASNGHGFDIKQMRELALACVQRGLSEADTQLVMACDLPHEQALALAMRLSPTQGQPVVSSPEPTVADPPPPTEAPEDYDGGGDDDDDDEDDQPEQELIQSPVQAALESHVEVEHIPDPKPPPPQRTRPKANLRPTEEMQTLGRAAPMPLEHYGFETGSPSRSELEGL